MLITAVDFSIHIIINLHVNKMQNKTMHNAKFYILLYFHTFFTAKLHEADSCLDCAHIIIHITDEVSKLINHVNNVVFSALFD